MTFDEWYATQRHQLANEQVCRMIWEASAKEENEACAALFDQPYKEYFGRESADAIRARRK